MAATPVPYKILPGARVELCNGRFVDVTSGRYFAAGTRLIIHGGRIEAMPVGEEGPRGDVTVDLQGRTVLPGLFNTHSHVQMAYPSLLLGLGTLLRLRRLVPRQVEKRMADCLDRGVTHVRDALEPDLRLNQKLNARIVQGELPGPRVYPSVLVAPLGGVHTRPVVRGQRLIGGLVGMPSVDWELPASGMVVVRPDATPQQVRQAVDRAIDERGAHTIKLYDQRTELFSGKPGVLVLTPVQVEAAADQARRRGVPCTMHHVLADSFRLGVQAGVTSLAHLPYDAALTEADLQACLASGCLVEPTVSTIYYMAWRGPSILGLDHPRMQRLEEFRARTYTALVDAHWIPQLVRAAKGMFYGMSRARRRGLIDLSALTDHWGMMIINGVENLQRIYEAGIPLTASNDAGAVQAVDAMVGHELALLGLFLNENGPRFSPADALRAATLNSARSLGLEASFGSLEPGKVADLVVVDGDVLADAGLIGAPAVEVWKEGKLVVDECGLGKKVTR